MTYLRDAGHCTQQPSQDEHQFAAPSRIIQAERMHDGKITVQTDGNEDEGGQVESKGTKKHE